MQCALSRSRVCLVKPVASCRDKPIGPARRPLANGAAPVLRQPSTETAPSKEMLIVPSSALLFLLTEAPAFASAASPFADSEQSKSLWVTTALFLMCVPGIWSQIKRAPQSSRKRKVFEVDGPARSGAMPIDDRARQIFKYFKSYNYEVKETGDVITFAGQYKAENGQAAAVTFYTFCGMASVALVLSIVLPDIGNYWYSLCLLSPLAAVYYYRKGTRTEEMKVKMVTSDDDQVTDITIEGDQEEIERFRKELNLMEKGKVYVKGILEPTA